MKTSILSTVLALSMVALAAAPADAGGCGRRSYSYGHSHTIVHRPVIVHKPVYVAPPCHEPHHCHCFVLPGDTWQSVALREYGDAGLWTHIARFNSLPSGTVLSAGQQLLLPKISPSGILAASTAPAPAGPPAGFAGGLPGGAVPGAASNPLAAGNPGFNPAMNAVGQGFSQQPGLRQQPGLGQQPGFGQQPGLGQSNQGFGNNSPNMGSPNMGGQNFPQSGPPNMGSQQPNNNGIQNPASQNGPAVNNNPGSFPGSNPTNITVEPAKGPSVAVGSMLRLDGTGMGTAQGFVRLRVGEMALPVQVLEWNESSAKIQLPQFEIQGTKDAQLEVLRADGSRVSTSPIQLTNATTQLALGAN